MSTALLGRFADGGGREQDAGTGGVLLTTATIPAYTHRRHPPHDDSGSIHSDDAPHMQRPGRPSVLFVGTDGSKQPAERGRGTKYLPYLGDHDSRPASLSWNSMAPTRQVPTEACCVVMCAQPGVLETCLNRTEPNPDKSPPSPPTRARHAPVNRPDSVLLGRTTTTTTALATGSRDAGLGLSCFGVSVSTDGGDGYVALSIAAGPDRKRNCGGGCGRCRVCCRLGLVLAGPPPVWGWDGGVGGAAGVLAPCSPRVPSSLGQKGSKWQKTAALTRPYSHTENLSLYPLNEAQSDERVFFVPLLGVEPGRLFQVRSGAGAESVTETIYDIRGDSVGTHCWKGVWRRR